MIDFVDNPAIAPKLPEDSGGGGGGGGNGVTPNSFTVEFDIVPELEVNGLIDKYVY